MVSASDFSTHVALPYARQDETRAAALRVLERTGNADVAEALGLIEPERVIVAGRPVCPTCGRPRPKGKHGGYKPCQRQLCSGGAE